MMGAAAMAAPTMNGEAVNTLKPVDTVQPINGAIRLVTVGAQWAQNRTRTRSVNGKIRVKIDLLRVTGGILPNMM